MSRSADRADVPQVAVPRLARYLRLADRLGVNAAQIRKDLSYFGEFGIRGVGYDVKFLISELSRCLGIDRDWNMVILGAGQLGSALARYEGFRDEGFNCVAVFDREGGTAGEKVAGHTVRPIEELVDFIRDNDVQIAVVAVPAEAAAEVAALAVEGGVRGILNFAPVRLPAVPNVFIHQLDLATELMVISYYLSQE
jgi:redox-sensing transcriptional repressor